MTVKYIREIVELKPDDNIADHITLALWRITEAVSKEKPDSEVWVAVQREGNQLRVSATLIWT